MTMRKALETRQAALADEAATVAFGAELAQALKSQYPQGAVIFLQGQLGAGKTTMVRGIFKRPRPFRCG